MSNREGIEIDYCPTCRGVWLDRGELDKIIERSAAEQAPAPPQGAPVGNRRVDYDDDDDRRYADPRYNDPRYSDPRYAHKRKRKGLLGELFDFD
jgi:Zn-finger nucleic acid-binding protein